MGASCRAHACATMLCVVLRLPCHTCGALHEQLSRHAPSSPLPGPHCSPTTRNGDPQVTSTSNPSKTQACIQTYSLPGEDGCARVALASNAVVPVEVVAGQSGLQDRLTGLHITVLQLCLLQAHDIRLLLLDQCCNCLAVLQDNEAMMEQCCAVLCRAVAHHAQMLESPSIAQ